MEEERVWKLSFEVRVDRMRLEHVSEFKYFRYVLDILGTDDTVS